MGPPQRRGYVLLTTLWMLVALSAVAAATALVARRALAAAANRTAFIRAGWVAEGCASAAMSGLERALAEAGDPARTWESLDSLAESYSSPNCFVAVRPVGLSLNVNTASEADLIRFARAMRLDPARADSLAAAILDWRDADSIPRPAGTEATWYRAAGRLGPRNAPFQSPRELLLVRGAKWLPGIDTLLSPENDPVLLTRAPEAVIAGLPHLPAEAVGAILAARRSERHLDLAAIAQRLNPPVRTTLLANLPALSALTTSAPAAWILECKGFSGAPPRQARLRLRVSRDGARLAVLRREIWP
ncbi:MAG TPA: hypothetical protein VF483_06370 [Gemmatimonadaceae bacterium]